MTEYSDDPVVNHLEQQIEISNYNAICFNALLTLLIEKGVVMAEEFRIYRLRELADFDRVQARLLEAAERAHEPDQPL